MLKCVRKERNGRQEVDAWKMRLNCLSFFRGEKRRKKQKKKEKKNNIMVKRNAKCMRKVDRNWERVKVVIFNTLMSI